MKLVKAISLPGLIKATSYGETEYGELLTCPNEYQRLLLAKFKDNLPIEIIAYRSGPNIVSEFNENLVWSATPKRVDNSLVLEASFQSNGCLVVQVNRNTTLKILEIDRSKVPKSAYMMGLTFYPKLKESQEIGTGPLLFPILNYSREFSIKRLSNLKFKQAAVEKTVQKILFRLDEKGVKAYVKTTHFVRSVPPTPQALTPFIFGLFRDQHPLPYLIGRVE